MKKRLVPLALTAALLLAFGAIAAACGGDGGGGDALTLEEYFQRLDKLENEASEKQDAAEAALENLPEAEALERLPEVISRQIAALEDFGDGLEDLDPPAEVEELHQDALDAFQGVITAFRDLEDELAGAESFADLEELFAQADAAAAQERLTQVCLDAEQLAADNDITVDLDCEEE